MKNQPSDSEALLTTPDGWGSVPQVTHSDVIDWLLDSDPAIRWQVERDLLDAPEQVWRATRALVETEGWGARLLAHQDADGQWAGGAFVPAGFDWDAAQASPEPWSRIQPWTATYPTLVVLRDLGWDPQSPRAQRMVELLRQNCRWEHEDEPFWDGEVEPCINGMTVALGSYFGVDVLPIVDRLLGERLPDGGWNCEAEFGSTVSSFDSTTDVLEGLLAYQLAAGGSAALVGARHEAEEYLLRRRLYCRLSTGEPANPVYLTLGHPFRFWHSVLRSLDYFRRASIADRRPPDPRLTEAAEWLRSVCDEDGTWHQQLRHGGATWFDMEPVGEPSRWLTLYALRIERWLQG